MLRNSILLFLKFWTLFYLYETIIFAVIVLKPNTNDNETIQIIKHIYSYKQRKKIAEKVKKERE